MTTLTLNIKDDRKVEDVLRFLRDIDFLEVLEPEFGANKHSDRTGFLSRFAGAWKGEILVREEQGNYEVRSELK
jgi:hypothetical protein